MEQEHSRGLAPSAYRRGGLRPLGQATTTRLASEYEQGLPRGKHPFGDCEEW